MRAPLGTDAFNVEFVMQAAGCIDWSAVSPWMEAAEAKLGAALPASVYKLHVLAVWFKLDGPALERACTQRAEFRRFIAAPLHGPIIDVQLYRQYSPRFDRAKSALNRLVAAVELQLVDHGFFPANEVLGTLDLGDPSGRTTVPTLVLPRAPHAAAAPSEPHPSHPVQSVAAAAPAPQTRPMLIWPWGEITVVDRRIHIGRDAAYSEFAGHFSADRKVSRKHAVVEPTDGGVLVHDLGSANGTYVDDEPLNHAGSAHLCTDAVLKFGTDLTATLVFVPR